MPLIGEQYRPALPIHGNDEKFNRKGHEKKYADMKEIRTQSRNCVVLSHITLFGTIPWYDLMSCGPVK